MKNILKFEYLNLIFKTIYRKNEFIRNLFDTKRNNHG